MIGNLRSPIRMSCSCGSCGRCLSCKIVKIIVSIFLTLTTIASFLGVWRTHFLPTGVIFGTPDGSLALLVFIVSLHFWYRSVKGLCPCRNASCCAKCNKDPCLCPAGKSGGKMR